MATRPNSRRELLRGAGLTALGVGLSACAGRAGAPAARAPGPRQRVAPVKVAEDRIYLPAMVREVRLAGGRIVVRELQDRRQIHVRSP